MRSDIGVQRPGADRQWWRTTGIGMIALAPLSGAATVRAQTTAADPGTDINQFRLDPQNTPMRAQGPAAPDGAVPVVRHTPAPPAHVSITTPPPVMPATVMVPDGAITSHPAPHQLSTLDHDQRRPARHDHTAGSATRYRPATRRPVARPTMPHPFGLPPAPVPRARVMTTPATPGPMAMSWRLLTLLGTVVAAAAAWGMRHRRAAAAPTSTHGCEAQPAPRQPLAPSPPPIRDPRPMVTFAVERLSQSLAFATLTYRLTLTNPGAGPIDAINVAARLFEGRGDLALALAAFARKHPPPDHCIATLAPGATVTLGGDLRLPLAGVRPIERHGHRLLIPLAAFTLTCRVNERVVTALASFVIGVEHDPPAARLAPLRLDLGPRVVTTPGFRVTPMPATA